MKLVSINSRSPSVSVQPVAVCTNLHRREKTTVFLDESVWLANESIHACLPKMVEEVLQLPEGMVQIEVAEFRSGKLYCKWI